MNEERLKTKLNESIERFLKTSTNFQSMEVNWKIEVSDRDIVLYFNPSTNEAYIGDEKLTDITVKLNSDTLHELFMGQINIMNKLAEGAISIDVNKDVPAVYVFDVLETLEPLLDIYPKFVS